MHTAVTGPQPRYPTRSVTCRQGLEAPPVLILAQLLGCQGLYGPVDDALVIVGHLPARQGIQIPECNLERRQKEYACSQPPNQHHQRQQQQRQWQQQQQQGQRLLTALTACTKAGCSARRTVK